MEKTRRAGPKPIYDWPALQSPGKKRVRRGRDFECNVGSFVSLLHRRADADGFDVETTTSGDEIEFEFVPKPKRSKRRSR